MTRDIRNIKPDLDAQLNDAFNLMIGEVLDDLATEANSPVYTGFLASSWRAQKSQVRQKDRVEDFEPWASIKRNHDLPVGGAPWKKKDQNHLIQKFNLDFLHLLLTIEKDVLLAIKQFIQVM